MKAIELIVRCGVWMLLMCVLVLSSKPVTDMVPYDHKYYVFLIVLEVISIVVLRRFPPSSVASNCIDISLYCLLLKGIALISFFFNAPLYYFVWGYVEAPFFGFFFLLAYSRLLWTWRLDGKFQFRAWPPIGPYGWTNPLASEKATGDEKIWLFVLTLCLAIAAFGLTNVNQGWYPAVAAGTGLILLGVGISVLVTKVTSSINEHQDRATLIAGYENTILEAGRALAALRKTQGTEPVKQPATHDDKNKE